MLESFSIPQSLCFFIVPKCMFKFVSHWCVWRVFVKQDPHKELANQNVLMVVHSVAQTAVQFGLEEETVKSELALSRLILHEARQYRPKPHLDNKIITSWNGQFYTSVLFVIQDVPKRMLGFLNGFRWKIIQDIYKVLKILTKWSVRHFYERHGYLIIFMKCVSN